MPKIRAVAVFCALLMMNGSLASGISLAQEEKAPIPEGHWTCPPRSTNMLAC